jgi:aspartate/methionine/tyrosine aminotransferase
VAAIRAALEGGARLVYLESPSRLSGAVFTPAEVKEIAGLVKKFDARVIWDQGLAPWAYGEDYLSLAAVADMADRVALIGEAWPGTGLDSLMVGYVAVREERLESIRSQKQIMSICTSTPSQYAALKAPTVYRALHKAQAALLVASRERAGEAAKQLCVKVVTGNSANLIAIAPADAAASINRLTAAGFVIADGSDFGAPGVVRLAVTPENSIAKALAHFA